MHLPNTFYCPITKRIMKDPVQDREGNTFEKEAIISWLENDARSPITRSPMSVLDLVPNRAVQDAIHQEVDPLVGDDWSILDDPDQFDDSEKHSRTDNVNGIIEDDVSIDILAMSGNDSNNETDVLISVKPPDGTNVGRVPVDLCCVIDVSGSMDTYAEIKTIDDEGNETIENTGLTVLDVVKHALRTIIANLQDGDRLGLVTFSDNAETIMELSKMDDNGKTQAKEKVNNLRTTGCTNLWDGLKTGMSVLTRGRQLQSMRANSLFLLTDGMPNINPPRGIEFMMKTYMDEHDISCTVNTFGFGYELDSALLNNLAIQGKGIYSFIPDAGMVGTVFVHSLANLLVTMANKVELSLEAIGEAEILNMTNLEDANFCTTASWGIKVFLGTLQYGQTKDVVIRMKNVRNGAYLRAVLNYSVIDSLTVVTKDSEGTRISSSVDEEKLISIHKNRLTVVDALLQGTKIAQNHDSAYAQNVIENMFKNTVELIKNSISAAEPEVVDLLTDLREQGTIAFDTDYYQKWGKHYIPSLSRAHLMQQCNNFKDPGVQHYGGVLFRELRDKIDMVFDDLPSAVPSRQKYDHQTKSYTRSAPVSMSMYNSRSDPCYSGDSLISMNDGKNVRADSIRKDDIMSNGARVKCVVRSKVQGGETSMVDLSRNGMKLFITPWHPVLDHNGEWVFPCRFAGTLQNPVVKRVSCPYIYSFVLHDLHTVPTAYESVGLGHGFTDIITSHPFLGTNAVLEHLQKMRGFEHGLVDTLGVKRDKITGLVNGFIPVTKSSFKQ